MVDRFNSYLELLKYMVEGQDFRVICEKRSTDLVFIAPHGGRIEPGTSQIARALAGNRFSLYCFEGLRKKEIRDLHITSHHFDEPRALALVKECKLAIAIHGYKGKGESIELGGLNDEVKKKIKKALIEQGFDIVDSERYPGRKKTNICNRCIGGKGVQLEFPRSMRQLIYLEPNESKEIITKLKDGIYTALNL